MRDEVKAESVVLAGVSHTHGARTPWARPALHDLNLRIEPGERVLVQGANGSGKSTLAWILAGLIEPTAGTATYGDEAISSHRDAIGLVIQHTRLQLLRPTIGEELAAFTKNRTDQLDALHLMGFELRDMRRRVDDLSIGQQRRVGLASQLARRASLLVLDEPLAGLDPVGRASLVHGINSLPYGTTVITVTHDLGESAPLGERVLELSEGRVASDQAIA